MENIKRYFKNLTETQISQFEALDALYRDWNEKINVISRKDIEDSMFRILCSPVECKDEKRSPNHQKWTQSTHK